MANTKSRTLTLINSILLLMLMQAIRWFLVRRIGADVHGNAQLGLTASIMVLLTLSAFILALSRFWRLRLYLLPAFTSTKDRMLYIAATCVTVFVLVTAPIRAGGFSLSVTTSLLYSAVILPAFEELVFRGYLWARLRKSFSPEITVCMVTSLLFAAWKVGYGDLWTFGGGFSAVDFFTALLTVTVSGLVLGLVTGTARLLSKNCVPGLLVHMVLAAAVY